MAHDLTEDPTEAPSGGGLGPSGRNDEKVVQLLSLLLSGETECSDASRRKMCKQSLQDYRKSSVFEDPRICFAPNKYVCTQTVQPEATLPKAEEKEDSLSSTAPFSLHFSPEFALRIGGYLQKSPSLPEERGTRLVYQPMEVLGPAKSPSPSYAALSEWSAREPPVKHVAPIATRPPILPRPAPLRTNPPTLQRRVGPKPEEPEPAAPFILDPVMQPTIADAVTDDDEEGFPSCSAPTVDTRVKDTSRVSNKLNGHRLIDRDSVWPEGGRRQYGPRATGASGRAHGHGECSRGVQCVGSV